MIMQNLMMMGAMAKAKVRKFLSNEKGEVNIVAIVVLIGIAVLLALIFKEKIEELLDSLFGTITTNATDAVGGSGSGE